MKQQRGLSLIELMVAIVISSILLLGVLQLFSNTSASDRTNTAIARVQESGRVALEIIGDDARRAGYQGCSSASNEITVAGIKFPDQAVQASDKSVTFHYATQEDTGTAFSTSKTCGGQALYLKTVTYSQCTDGTSLCMNGDPILDHASVTAINFGLADAGNTIWEESASVTAEDLKKARSVSVTLELQDPRSEITRSFTNTYEFRNRL